EQIVAFTPSMSDNCPGTTVACTPASGSTFAKGTNTVVCAAADAAGNTNNCSFAVIVADSEAPVIDACPADVVTNTAAGQCTALITYVAPTAADNCGAALVACSPASGSLFTSGVTIVTCTAADESSNTNACTFTVTVNDLEPPVIVCPPDITTNTAPESSSQVIVYTVDFTDNCPGASVSCVPGSGASLPLGVTTVNCVATDAAGNTDPCSFTVTLVQLLVANTDTLGALQNHSVVVLAEKLLANDTAGLDGILTLISVSA